MPVAARPAQSHSHSHSRAGGQTLSRPKLYNPRHPERSLLYQTIAEHFETWFEIASAGQFDGQGDHHTPKPYVRQAFRKYHECGHLCPRLCPRPLRRLWARLLRRYGVLRIFLRVIAQSLQSHSPGAVQVGKAALHIGAVAFIHRFGSSLNEHVHFHVCVVNGLFEEVMAKADGQDATDADV